MESPMTLHSRASCSCLPAGAETLSVDTGKNDSNIITPGAKPLVNNAPASPVSPTSRANNHRSQHRATPALKSKKHPAGAFVARAERVS